MTEAEQLAKIAQDIGQIQGTVEGLKGSVDRFVNQVDRRAQEQARRCDAHTRSIAENRAKISALCHSLDRTRDAVKENREDLADDVKELSTKSGLKAGAVSGLPGGVAFGKLLFDAVRDLFSGG
jgi:methyl-accepting chemotaxis protein